MAIKEWGGALGGCLAKDKLYELVKEHIQDYTPRHFQRLLQSGVGLFWTLDDRGRVWMTGSVELSKRLCKLFPGSRWRSDRPGGIDMLIPVDGPIQQFRAHLLSAWLESRGDRLHMVSQDTMGKLFGRSPRTMRSWLKRTPRTIILSNHEQTPVTADTDPAVLRHLPNPIDDPSVHILPGWDGNPIVSKRLPNTYIARGYGRKIETVGKARKRRRAANGVLSDLVTNGAKQHCQRLYWTDAKRLERHNKRSDQPMPGLLWRGETRHARRTWERTMGIPETRPDCIARGLKARRIRHDWQVTQNRVRTFSSATIMGEDMTTRMGGAPDPSQGGGGGCKGGAGDIHRWITPEANRQLSPSGLSSGPRTPRIAPPAVRMPLIAQDGLRRP